MENLQQLARMHLDLPFQIDAETQGAGHDQR